MSTDTNDKPWTLEELVGQVQTMMQMIGTLNSVIICLIRTMEREGIKIEQLNTGSMH